MSSQIPYRVVLFILFMFLLLGALSSRGWCQGAKMSSDLDMGDPGQYSGIIDCATIMQPDAEPFILYNYGNQALLIVSSTGVVSAPIGSVTTIKHVTGAILYGLDQIISESQIASFNANRSDLVIGATSASGTSNGMTIVSGDAGTGSIAFADGWSGALNANDSIRGRIDYDHSDDTLALVANNSVRLDLGTANYFTGETHFAGSTDAGAYDLQVESGGDEIGNNWNTHASFAYDPIREKWMKRDIRSATGQVLDRTKLTKLTKPVPRKWKYEPGYFLKSMDELMLEAKGDKVLAGKLLLKNNAEEKTRIANGFYDKEHFTLVYEETPDEFKTENAFKSRYIRSWLMNEVNRLSAKIEELEARIERLEQP